MPFESLQFPKKKKKPQVVLWVLYWSGWSITEWKSPQILIRVHIVQLPQAQTEGNVLLVWEVSVNLSFWHYLYYNWSWKRDLEEKRERIFFCGKEVERERGIMLLQLWPLSKFSLCRDTLIHLCSYISQSTDHESDANRGSDLLKEPSGYRV